MQSECTEESASLQLQLPFFIAIKESTPRTPQHSMLAEVACVELHSKQLNTCHFRAPLCNNALQNKPFLPHNVGSTSVPPHLAALERQKHCATPHVAIVNSTTQRWLTS